MKRLAVLFGALLMVASLQAQTQPLLPQHRGYAFEQPKILSLQRLFGLAHGVTLLAVTCLADGAATKSRETLLLAYAKWDQAQTPVIEEAERTLSSYFFGDHAAEAKWSDIVTAIGLKNNLDLKPGSLEMVAACDSLPDTLEKSRYNLRQQYQLQTLASRLAKVVTLEAEGEACLPQLSESSRADLTDALARWRENTAASAEEARATLTLHWADAQLDGTLEGWISQAQEQGSRAAKAKMATGDAVPTCAAMSSWLSTQYSDPDDDFKPRP